MYNTRNYYWHGATGMFTLADITTHWNLHLKSARTSWYSLRAVKEMSSVEKFLQEYNTLWVHIDAVASSASLMSNVHPDEAVRAAAEKAEQQITQLLTEFYLDKAIYRQFEQISADRRGECSTQEQRLLQKTMQDFRRAGVLADEKTQEKIKQLNDELVMIGQEFARNIRDDVRHITLSSREELHGLPEDYITAHPPKDDGLIYITTEYPDYMPFMRYATSADLRKRLGKEFANRAYPKNISVLQSLLTKRHELATLLGYSTWADYVTENKMIEKGEAVRTFINDLVSIATPRAKQEYTKLLALKRTYEPEASQVYAWESAFLEEQIIKKEYAFDSQLVREYFSYHEVKKGLFLLTSTLFDVRFEKNTTVDVWHESVEVFDVYTKNVQIGQIYLDMHPRAGKYTHAAQFTIQNGIKDVQLPKGVLVCNFTDPAKSPDGVALLDHGQVVTFFHEFGHLLHHILGGQQRWIQFSGTATEWDFVEVPSQLLEEWAWDHAMLKQFAFHYKTGEPIPAELIHAMRKAEEFGKGIFVRQQTFYAALSLHYYHQDPKDLDTTAVLKELQSVYSIYPYIDETYMQLNFGHLDGYSAMYYTYMWSLVIAKDLFSVFDANNLLDPTTAEKYRRCILEPGGSKPAKELIQDFLGRPYSLHAFREWLKPE